MGFEKMFQEGGINSETRRNRVSECDQPKRKSSVYFEAGRVTPEGLIFDQSPSIKRESDEVEEYKVANNASMLFR